jgi:hypothetical protein
LSRSHSRKTVIGMRTRSKRKAIWTGVLALAAATALAQAQPAHAATTTDIRVDGTGTGRVFDGVGALSGGGGTSRLLPDYPEPARSQVLDLLFKPDFGAGLQLLKVEIGSDVNSTNGAEASHQRTPTDQNYQRGYEWWLMEQAKARNPEIGLGGLEWGAPGWFNGGVGGPDGFYSQDNINYIVNWLIHAKSDHGLDIATIGGWNESNVIESYSAHHDWFINLKQAVVAAGLPTKLVAFDATGSDLSIGNDMTADPALRAAVDIMGIHYPCRGIGQPANSCLNTSTLQAIGKPIWASEHGSQHFDLGAPQLARALNRDYIDSRITAMIDWNAVASWYQSLPDWGESLMQADQPWSGWYHVGKSIWVTAHTTQFAKPGWQYLDAASGYLGGARANGSYVTLKSPDGADYSTIVETADATAPQTANFTVAGGLSTGPVHVWATKLVSADPADDFAHVADVTPVDGAFSLTLQPGFVYSVTTTTGQHKGTPVSPPPAPLAMPYTDTFEQYPNGSLAKYVSAVQGAFETAPCTGGRRGQCLRQVISQPPIAWPIGSSTRPLAVTGDPTWTNYQTSVDALLEQAGSVDVVGRLQAQAQFGGAAQGYHLRVASGGQWTLFREDVAGNDTTLASGTRPFGVNAWHRLTLDLNGNRVRAMVDGWQLASVRDTTYNSGNVGLMVSKWQNAQFDNLAVTRSGSAGTVTMLDDADQGRFVYTGTGWRHCISCGADLFHGSNSFDNVAGDSVTVTFTGRRVTFFGVRDPGHGIGAVSIDGGRETEVDFFAPFRAGTQPLWTSPLLRPGTHTFRLRVTGTMNDSSGDTFVVPDRLDILPA